MAEGEQHYWTGENYELELSKFLLSQDNMALRSEIKSLRESLNEATKLINDLEDICRGSVPMNVPTCTCTERNNLRELVSVQKVQEHIRHAFAQHRYQALQKLEEKHRLSLRKLNQDLHEKVKTIELLESSTEEHLATIEELRTEKKRLEAQIWKALVFDGPHVEPPMAEAADVEELPHSNVEVSDVVEEEKEKEEEEEQEEKEEQEEEEEQEIKQDGQTKSWWRRQADKVTKSMGTFCRQFTCCLGTRKRRVV